MWGWFVIATDPIISLLIQWARLGLHQEVTYYKKVTPEDTTPKEHKYLRSSFKLWIPLTLSRGFLI